MTNVKCGKCLKNINDNISASIKCNKCENWFHKKCTELSPAEFSKICSENRKQPHKWICDVCVKHSNFPKSPEVESGLENTPTKKHQYTSFHCCKTHTFIHYVCVNCFKIYHKKCLLRFQNKIAYLGGHKINCCIDSITNCDETNNSILEKTINELAEENMQKNHFLNKLKKEK